MDGELQVGAVVTWDREFARHHRATWRRAGLARGTVVSLEQQWGGDGTVALVAWQDGPDRGTRTRVLTTVLQRAA